VEKAKNLEKQAQSAYFLSKFKVGRIFERLSPTGC
jgi:hypothetical protein